ncbi:MAG: carbamoyl-phosphate synthase large subunit [Erythrobacter sp.]|jgi:hypothetical protein|nr:carbamoyl-phosphate synthase large subunit [Erythrobacter sp.]
MTSNLLHFAMSMFLSFPALAQNPAMTPPPLAEWPGAEIAEGVAFQGNGSITIEPGIAGAPVLAFWRPVLFGDDPERPHAGRMDCRIVAAEEPFSDAAFDPDAKHDRLTETRERQGFDDRKRLRDYGEHVRRLDVIGRQRQPFRNYVLSYILVRDGDRLIDVRRNCTFIHGSTTSNPDVLPYVDRYTAITFAFEPGDARAQGRSG